MSKFFIFPAHTDVAPRNPLQGIVGVEVMVRHFDALKRVDPISFGFFIFEMHFILQKKILDEYFIIHHVLWILTEFQ